MADLWANDWAVLGAIGERPTHGYAVSLLLAPNGPLGQIWTLRRSEVYNSVKKLTRLELISEQRTELGTNARNRTILRITPTGRRWLRKWLADPVEHVRDVRNLLLLKLFLLHRSDHDSSALIQAQIAKLTLVLEGLESLVYESEGFDRVVAVWRAASCRATLDFLAAVSR
jgi:DNA-binding PadR family transcriptional regulator